MLQMDEAALQDRLFSLQSEKTDFLMMSETNRSSEVDQIRTLLSTASERESTLLHQLSTLQMERYATRGRRSLSTDSSSFALNGW